MPVALKHANLLQSGHSGLRFAELITAGQNNLAEVAIMLAGVLRALVAKRLNFVEDVESCDKLLAAWREHDHSQALAHSIIVASWMSSNARPRW